MENRHKCRRCGYSLEACDPEYCLPCTARIAICAMSGIPTTRISQVARPAVATVEENAAAVATAFSERLNREKPASKNKAIKRSNKKNSLAAPLTSRVPPRPARAIPGSGYIRCILCGQPIKKGELLAHKSEVHGEGESRSTPQKRRDSTNTWVSIFQGGLPGLGKRR